MIQFQKKIGETPLEALQRLRRQQPALADARLSYAGRLDPMASGVLPVLVGEENDRREAFLHQDKQYRFTILLGVQTDSFDLLGMPEEITEVKSVTKKEIVAVATSFIGDWEMPYPPYASKTVMLDGQKTPLWKVARADRLEEIELPTKVVEIYDFKLTGTDTLTTNYIIDYITKYIGRVEGGFRQQQIINCWEERLTEGPETVPAASFRISCSSGTYVRRLAERIGGQLGCGACIFSLHRLAVGQKNG